MPIQYDKSVKGQTADVGSFEITDEMIRNYNSAIGAPIDAADLVAGPLFCNILTTGSIKPEVQIEGGRRRFMAGQSYEPIAPIRPGDRINLTATVADIYEKTGRSGGMLFVVRETTFTNQNNQAVAKMRHSMVVQE